jgi:hypothetical protein
MQDEIRALPRWWQHSSRRSRHDNTATLDREGPTMPTTDAGKAVSRRNALKHGLTPNSSLLPPDMEAQLPLRIAPWAEKFAHLTDPQTPFLIRELAVAELRVEQCQATLAAAANFHLSPARRKNAADLAAANLFARLAKRPEHTVQQLRQTSAGVARLLRAWTTLHDNLTPWTAADLEHTLDLLGLEANERFSNSDALDLKEATNTLLHNVEFNAYTQARKTLDAFFALQIESLQSLAADLAAEDAALQALADSGHDLEPPPQILKLRRYESANRRIYTNAVAKLEALAAEAAAEQPEPEPAPAEPQVPSTRSQVPGTQPPSSFGSNPAPRHPKAARSLVLTPDLLADLEEELAQIEAIAL